MLDTDGRRIDPWALREAPVDLRSMAKTESLFALSNGHIGIRGTLDEDEPHALPGTYLNGVYETRLLQHAEVGYGFPEASQTVVNVTNGKVIRLLVDDEPLDIRYGEVLEHERVLDFRAGTLTRDLRWRSPAGQNIRLRSTRLVSLAQRAVLAIRWEVEALDEPARIIVQSDLVANEPLPPSDDADPRTAARLRSPLAGEYSGTSGNRVTLVHRTHESALRVGAAMDHILDDPSAARASAEASDDAGRVSITAELEPREPFGLVKLVTYGWSSQRSMPAVRDQVDGAAQAARETGWDELVTAQREALARFWSAADVELDGDPEVQQALRFGMFQTLQAGARAERRAIPAKGLTGHGYQGHAFWETESFILPLLTYTAPKAAADALIWRYDTLPEARHRAQVLGLRGAKLPWRTISGPECSGYWPAGTAAMHVVASVAAAVERYVHATDDVDFERGVGVELLVETARLWHSVGHGGDDGFRIDGVTGPDEYTALVDNNVYTNLMAQRNLRAAATAVERYPERADELGVDRAEVRAWRVAADDMAFPYDAKLGVHPQSEGFTDHDDWDFAETGDDHYPLFLHFPYFQLYRQQVIKQPDLVLALHVCGDCFTAEEKRRNFHYYEQRTVRDSSLAACTQSIVAAEVGHVDLAYDYLAESALIDLHDLHSTTKNGLHLGALAGAWLAAVAGLGGMRDHGGELTFAPRLPDRVERLRFGLCFRGRQLRIEVERDQATYHVESGDPLSVGHHGRPIVLDPGVPVTEPVPPAPDLDRPTQPPGRAPRQRVPSSERTSTRSTSASTSPRRG